MVLLGGGLSGSLPHLRYPIRQPVREGALVPRASDTRKCPEGRAYFFDFLKI